LKKELKKTKEEKNEKIKSKIKKVAAVNM
jgi:hypothetical protein